MLGFYSVYHNSTGCQVDKLVDLQLVQGILVNCNVEKSTWPFRCKCKEMWVFNTKAQENKPLKSTFQTETTENTRALRAKKKFKEDFGTSQNQAVHCQQCTNVIDSIHPRVRRQLHEFPIVSNSSTKSWCVNLSTAKRTRTLEVQAGQNNLPVAGAHQIRVHENPVGAQHLHFARI